MIFHAMTKKSFPVAHLLITVLCFFVSTNISFASVTIKPFFIDEVVAAREERQILITLNNEYPTRKAVVYATVNEIAVDDGGEIKEFIIPEGDERIDTVTGWIEIGRGRIEIPSGESREIPLTIRTHPYAKPGQYFVYIGFVEAPNRPEAESIALNGKADGVIVKVTVSDNRVDSMHINKFEVNRFVTNDDKREISIELQNLGELASVPAGEIIFYDSKGIEVGSAPLNTEGVSIEPGKSLTLKSYIPIEDDLGRFKANLSIEYGQNQISTLHDTTSFYLIPLRLLAIIFGIVLIFTIFLVLLFRKAFFVHEVEEDFKEVTVYVRDGHDPNPKDHDIDLKKTF